MIQLILGHKRVRYTDFKRDKFNSELEAVEENSVSLTGRQASFRWPWMAYRKR
jgi:hypothetical protein